VDVGRLFSFLPTGSFLTDRDLLERYAHDVTGRFNGIPSGVARPSDVQEVARVLHVCDEHGVGIAPQGGNTGLVGGAIVGRDEIVLSLERLRSVADVDTSTSTVVAEAGATLENVRAAARAAGREFPIDFAARGSATIGGMVATDAGGAYTMRHGTMRDRVVGLQIVLADGTIIDHLRRPGKDSSGFDVTRLIPGSEGTLAVVTAARLALIEKPAHRAVALLALASLDDAAAVTSRLPDMTPSIEAVDFFLAEGLALVRSHANLRAPFSEPHAAFLVISCAAATDPSEGLSAVLEQCTEVADVAVAQSAQQQIELWDYRELHNEAINARGVPHKLDVAVSTLQVPGLVSRVDAWLAAEQASATALYYGHLADGNVHVNILGAPPDDDSIDEGVLRIVAEMGGSISAEHGIGQAKNRWLHLTRPPEEIAAMAAIKKALDPNGILNPGKLLPPEATLGNDPRRPDR
jgi:FAD/FMN-containing dehydrogenase